jgi:hypothetical protein
LENIVSTFKIESIEPGSPPNAVSTAGGTWCYVTGTGLYVDNTITAVNFGLGVIVNFFVLSDEDMWFLAPPTSAFVMSNGEHVTPGLPFNIEFEYISYTADGEGHHPAPIQKPFLYKYLPAVEAVIVPPVCPAVPPVLWVTTAGESPNQGMVTLNEPAQGVDVKPVLGSDNPEVSVGQPTVLAATGTATTAQFPITVSPGAQVGSTVNISSGPGPNMDPDIDHYASLAAVIGEPPIYLSLPGTLVSGQQTTGVVYVQSAPSGQSPTLTVVRSNVVAAIPGRPLACAGAPGVFPFNFTPAVVSGRAGEFTITVTCGGNSVPFGPFTVRRPITPPPPPGPSPI